MTQWLQKFPQELQDKVAKVEKKIQPQLDKIDQQVLNNQARILDAFRKFHVAEEDLVGSTGYGYDDVGRDKLENIYADYFKTEAALVRPQLASGTHAITTSLMGQLRPGDQLLYLTGMPYDTIQQVIGIAGNNTNTMKEWGIDFDYVPLTDHGKVDYEEAQAKLAANDNIKIVAIQRSRGYASRNSFTVAEIKDMITFVRRIRPEVIIFIDNCYGEFSEAEEATFYGADIMAGSLFKNAGAGFAKTGAYIVGKKQLVENAANRLLMPGGRDEGATYYHMRDFFEGFFMAPHTTGQAIKGMIFTSALLEEMGMNVSPKWNEPRTDVVQAVTFGKRDPMIKFCQTIQHYSPLNSFVAPIPSTMDNYADEVIMASGAFTEGSTIELSSDGPLREPYSLYIQGGLSTEHVKIAITNAVNEIFYQK